MRRCLPISARALSMVLVFATLPWAIPASSARPAPIDAASSAIILDYQRMEAFRDRLRRAVVHLAVVEQVQPGFDPQFAPRRFGAATFVRLPDGREVILSSAMLTAESARLTLVRRSGEESEARVVRTLDDLGVAVLEAVDRKALRDIQPLELDQGPTALDVGRTVFSLDNLASGFEVVVWGQVDENGEPPLTHLRVASLRLSPGHPLVSAGQRVTGLCFRPVTPANPVCFASRATDILTALGADTPIR